VRIFGALGRPHRAAIAVVAGALLAAGCGGAASTTTTSSKPPLAVASIEKAIQQSIHTQHGITTVVTCPTNAPRKTGYRFYCTAALDAGTYAVVVRELNTRGGVSYSNSAPLNVLDSHRIALAITEAVRSKRHLKATVTCPASILQAKGVKFTCRAEIKKGAASFLVTETDSHGHVSFIGL
jgi:hypothetical protein